MKKIYMVLIAVFIINSSALVSMASEITLSDISGHWANECIQELIERGAVSGYPDGTFKPEKEISRAEFTKVLLCSIGSDPGNAETGYWADNYIRNAMEKGYLKDGEFEDPTGSITRGEIARMVWRSMYEAVPFNISDYKKQIKDYDLIPSNFQLDVLHCFVKGIVTGFPDGTFGYDRTASRAEACTMIMRRLDASKRVIPVLKSGGSSADGEDESFIEPDISVVHNTNPYDPYYFTIQLDNYKDYNDEYLFKIEFINYPQLNVAEIRGMNGWVMRSYNDWRTYENLITLWNGEFYKLINSSYTTREHEKTFKISDGMEIEYVVTIKKGSKERYYPGKVVVKAIEFQ